VPAVGFALIPVSYTHLDVYKRQMVREVVVGPNGLARGVSYVDKKTRNEVTVYGLSLIHI